MPTLILYPTAHLYILQTNHHFQHTSHAKVLKMSSCPNYFLPLPPKIFPSGHHNNPQPAIHSWNLYRERQKGEALDVSLQGSSVTSLSPPGELWASCDLGHCQLGCKLCSCLCALLAPGSLVEILASICMLFQLPASQSEKEGHLSYTKKMM